MSKKKTGKRGQTPKSPRSRLKQSTLQGEILAAKDSSEFGHELPEKKIALVTTTRVHKISQSNSKLGSITQRRIRCNNVCRTRT
jgi:hypothetical protein